MQVFDSACFGANSPLFIPAFKGSRKPTSNNSKTHPVDEREARERLKARKDHIRRLAAVDDVIRYDKYHAANLLATSNSMTTISQQRVSGTPLSTSTNTQQGSNPHPAPPFERKSDRVTPCAPTPTPISVEYDEDQPDGLTNEG